MPSIARTHAPERREDVRVVLNLSLRVRPLGEVGAEHGGLVADYEELGRLAQRFRREASPAGRKFVAKLMDVLDGLTARAESVGSAGWTPRTVLRASLSAGGLGYVGETPPTKGETVDVEFVVAPPFSRVPFQVVARVVRVARRPDGSFDVGLRFVDMRSSTRERLVRLVFDAQRTRLRARAERS